MKVEIVMLYPVLKYLMSETTIGHFRHFFERFFVYDNFREKITSMLCYLVGVIVLCAFFRVIYTVHGYRLGWPES